MAQRERVLQSRPNSRLSQMGSFYGPSGRASRWQESYSRASGPVNDIDKLQKSDLYDIIDGFVQVVIHLDDEFRNRFHVCCPQYLLLVVPKELNMNDFATIRQAKALGVRVLQASPWVHPGPRPVLGFDVRRTRSGARCAKEVAPHRVPVTVGA